MINMIPCGEGKVRNRATKRCRKTSRKSTCKRSTKKSAKRSTKSPKKSSRKRTYESIAKLQNPGLYPGQWMENSFANLQNPGLNPGPWMENSWQRPQSPLTQPFARPRPFGEKSADVETTRARIMGQPQGKYLDTLMERDRTNKAQPNTFLAKILKRER